MSLFPDSFPSSPPDKTGWPWTEVSSPFGPSPEGDWPRVTIITPSFNQGDFIEETIRSVILQGYSNLEFIVIDGGSKDKTVEILKKYDRWIDFWVSEPDAGQSDAINKGLERASGDWFNWINSDDVLAPGALHRLAASACNAQCVCISGVTANLRGGEVFSRYHARLPASPAEFLFSLSVNQPGSLLNLAAVREAGGVRTDLRLVMDLDLWLRLALLKGTTAFERIEDEVAVYRYHEESKTCAEDDVFAVEEFALLADLLVFCGGVLPSGAVRLREKCRAASKPFPPNCNALVPPQAEAAWLDRMVINDSLFFRALRKTLPPEEALQAFRVTLVEFRPMLQSKIGSKAARRAEGTAMLHALQILGVHSTEHAWFSICRHPSLPTARAIARLLIQS
jgi:glycosyltransferase involved in cell wall biosynthesis